MDAAKSADPRAGDGSRGIVPGPALARPLRLFLLCTPTLAVAETSPVTGPAVQPISPAQWFVKKKDRRDIPAISLESACSTRSGYDRLNEL
jgi:hypothetical protein